MQKVKSVVFGVSLLLCASLALASEVRVTASKANVRSQPSLSGKVVGKVARGETLEVLGSSRRWLKINGSGVEGWIYAKLVEDLPEAAPSSKSKADADESGAMEEEKESGAPRKERAPLDQRRVTFGGGVSFANREVGFGIDGRVVAKPLRKLPNVRGTVAVDYFFKEDRGWKATINGGYDFDLTNVPLRPYVGAGLVISRAVGETFTDFDLAAGAEVRQRFFGEVRLVFSDPTLLVISAGVRF